MLLLLRHISNNFGSPQIDSRLATTEASSPQTTTPSSWLTLVRLVHTAVYKQKLNQYNEALKHHEQYIDQLLSEQAAELTKIIINVDTTVNN